MSRIFAIAILIMLAACGANSYVSQIADDQPFKDHDSGIAVLSLTVDETTCKKGDVAIGQASANGYKHIKTAQVGTGAQDRHAIAQLDLAPGSYHVIAISCVHADAPNRTQYLADFEKGSWGSDAVYKRSYATFSVARGEIVNLGVLRVDRRSLADNGKSPYVDLAVKDLDPAQRAIFAKEKPNIASRMVTRLFQVTATKAG